MGKLATRGLVFSLCAATAIFASGYKIPEQSLNSVALGAAYVANANGADASYYNPANMAWNDDANLIEVGLTYINLPPLEYTDSRTPLYNGKSKDEEFLLPTGHFSSKAYGKWRFGFSITAPGGLSKRWDTPYQKAYAQEFTLKVIEANPTFSYKVNDKFAVGGGLRAVYSDGIVKSSGSVSRDMTGDSVDFGYNVALTYKPTKEWTLATTYRSKVDLTIKGDADLYYGTTRMYSGGASVTIPLPAVWSIATSYTFKKRTTVEFVYERTYWSKYKDLDFNYDKDIGPLAPYFDAPVPKNWKDTDTYRIGVTHQYNDKLKLMVGFAIDKTPIPSHTLGFELPDSDAKLYSCGFEYKYSDQVSFGMAYLYDDKEDRTINTNDENVQNIDGEFEHISAHLVTLSLKYRF